MLKITFEYDDVKASIETTGDKDIHAVLEELVVPVLLGVGFQKETILDGMSCLCEMNYEDSQTDFE